MITVFILAGNELTREWDEVCSIPLIQSKEPTEAGKAWQIHDSEFNLPNGERLRISVAFTVSNYGLSFGIVKDGVELMSSFAYKKSLETFDPTVGFLTPEGMNISIMFGKSE